MPGAVDRSTDEARSSSTSLRASITRGDRVRTTMPGSTAREQLGTSTRAPSTSTTHRRQTLTGFSVSRKHSVGIVSPIDAQADRIVVPFGHADGATVDGERHRRRRGPRAGGRSGSSVIGCAHRVAPRRRTAAGA